MVTLSVILPIDYSEEDIKSAAALVLPIEKSEIKDSLILRRTLDLSDKQEPKYKAKIAIEVSDEREAGLLKMKKKTAKYDPLTFNVQSLRPRVRPVIIGAGPCGIFAALYLAEAGARPIVLERGLPVCARKERVALFARLGVLDPECNVQFGEGGAGTYSDGKLKVGAPDKYKMKVLREFIAAGAGEDIAYSATAHLGTDKLSDIVAALREKIISLGGEFIFGAKFTGFTEKQGRITSVIYEKDKERVSLGCEDAILAIGHSAKDTFERLYEKGVAMVAKGFGMGVRIEHPREYINELVYGKNYDKRLESASYHLVTHLPNGRSVYSFCMCPGGTVVPAASECGGIVTNGMSEYLRDGKNSNAAFLTSLTPEDYGSTHALAGVYFQRKIERGAFLEAGSDYKAPAIRMEDFVNGEAPKAPGSVKPTYPIGTVPKSPEKYLPKDVTDSLRAAIADFDSWMPGFRLADAVLTGPETRSTSPVRILRTEKYDSETVSCLYPAGEGAGYSGGIVSSAVDGLRCAEALANRVKAENREKA